MSTDTGLLTPRTPLGSGTTYTALSVVVGVALLFYHRPLPDAPPGNVRAQVQAVHGAAAELRDGVRMELPQLWTFATFVHPPQLQNQLSVPGMGQVRIGPPRRVLFAALRAPGTCVVILERDTIEQMDLDGDVAALQRTVAQNVYERNLYDWLATTRTDRFKLLVNTADEMLNRAGPSTRTIDFTPTEGTSSASLGPLTARLVGYTASLDGRETAGLLYAIAHQSRWQYALIAAVGEPPRQCTIEVTWIQEHLKFE